VKRLLPLFFLVALVRGFDLGGFIGEASHDRGATYGVFASLSVFPFTRIELEGSKFFGRGEKQICLNGELGVGLGGVHPYFSVGVGLDTGPHQEISLSVISSTSFFTTTGAGVKFSIAPLLMKMRIDIRRFSMGSRPYYRAYVGLFFSI